MESSLKYLGVCIRNARDESNLTQQELADQTGLSVKTIQDIETGRGNPTYDTLIRLIERLGISPDELFCDHFPAEDEALRHFVGKFQSCSKENQKVLLNTIDSLLESLLENQNPMY